MGIMITCTWRVIIVTDQQTYAHAHTINNNQQT